MTKYARYGLSLLLLFALPATAHADWHKAESDHFVVYADDKAKDVRKFAEQLERFHSAMSYLTNRPVTADSPSNRVTIFAVGDTEDVQELAGRSGNLAGFYVPRAGASRAFVPDIKLSSGQLDFSQVVLLHEYAHHFLWTGTSVAMPKWLSEGAAEFYATARFPKDGTVHIGLPAKHREVELAYADEVTARELFDPDLFESRHGKRLESFYGRSWLLYHLLIFEPSRKGQFGTYWNGLVQGADPLALAHQVFGDLDQLNRDMDRYHKARKWNYFDLDAKEIPIGSVTVSLVSAGMAEMMPVIIKSQRGVNGEEAEALLPDARVVAARHPSDADVLAALAEAEHDAGNFEAAIVAADKSLAIDPRNVNALVQKGYSMFGLAEDAEDFDTAFQEASEPFHTLNRLEPDHPIPLIYAYRSFQYRGMPPSVPSMEGLLKAARIAPFDSGLWFEASLLLAREGFATRARRDLLTIANNPHGGTLAERAKRIAADLAGAQEGRPYVPSPALFHSEPSEPLS